jgi:hypothetical protein
MSSKSDYDNRSNQLNPNNDAYYSSRGVSRSGGYDDDDEGTDDSSSSPYRFVERPRTPQWSAPRTETFAFAAVSMDCKVAFRTAVFEAPGDGNNARAAIVQLEDYLHDFAPLAKQQLAQCLAPSEMALFAVFDPTESCLPWHLPFSPKDPLMTRQGISLKQWDRLDLVSKRLQPMPERQYLSPFFPVMFPEDAKRIESARQELEASKLDPAPFVEALRNAVTLDARSWGAFSVPSRGGMTLSDSKSVTLRLSSCEAGGNF